MKKLKIQFWKAEKALAMQILEQEGLPEKDTGIVRITKYAMFYDDIICLRGSQSEYDLDLIVEKFNTNIERDAYLKKVVNAITDELFTGGRGELKVGEMCEVRSGDYMCWHKSELIAILPKKYTFRFFTKCTYDDKEFLCWRYARPIAKRTEPIVEECGQLITYTWEEK